MMKLRIKMKFNKFNIKVKMKKRIVGYLEEVNQVIIFKIG